MLNETPKIHIAMHVFCLLHGKVMLHFQVRVFLSAEMALAAQALEEAVVRYTLAILFVQSCVEEIFPT